MVQAAILDGLVFDAPPFSQDGFSATKVDVGRCQVADALVVAVVVVVFDECANLTLKIACAVQTENWSCHGYVPVSQLIYAAFRSNAKGLLPPSDEWRRRGL